MFQVRTTVISKRGDQVGPELKPLFDEMGTFHEDMARGSVLLDGSGLRPQLLFLAFVLTHWVDLPNPSNHRHCCVCGGFRTVCSFI